ncbi:uncharacterized protein PGTG_19252 [Puccinia graminis f. sp. tritici CRL 75-36-700-3]|uniref:DH domain-containing protein n=1 Tax=Puccinia graminis f. sp. tritici (strain CRL 75-36-700-3 / race SCCL) TaxID=418459 RepID=E3LA56_PUCGT|nr:uncharacterized protein PGTG_19252 [Puccinia graminis f. sp. tritici CRL 75-36-700-3]EFP93449.2 hypothetical protein PGTG_19252 [Puccinia graminis f. sp. tritici CRL 75-36-700-3]
MSSQSRDLGSELNFSWSLHHQTQPLNNHFIPPIRTSNFTIQEPNLLSFSNLSLHHRPSSSIQPSIPQFNSDSPGLGSIQESTTYKGFDQQAPLSDLSYSHSIHRKPSVDLDHNSIYARMSSMPSDQTLSGSQSGQLSPLLIRPRKSCESVRVMPTQPKQSTANDCSFSFSSGPSSRPCQPTTTLTSRPPIVYPALLSRVAEAFRSWIMLAERTKDGLTYTECFDGREADKITYIIKTTHRNLALLLGRALDSQKFFHDVTYDHRWRDSHHELYQFRGTLTNTFTAEQDNPRNSTHDSLQQTSRPISEAQSELDGLEEEEAQEDEVTEEEDYVLPCGVFTLLTDCYSPTCTRDRLCYSIACPCRLEQQARLNLKPKPGLQRSLSTESLSDLKEPGKLWIHSVPQEVVDSVNDTEKKRQEAINECIYTERDFVRDLEYLRDVWIKPLQASNIIPEARRQDFLSQVFWNVLEVLSVNSRLCELLSKRQKSAHLVPHFSPFVKYGAHQLYGKYEFEREKSANPAFAKFVDVGYWFSSLSLSLTFDLLGNTYSQLGSS